MKIFLTSILTVLIAISAFGETPADSVKVYFLVGHRLFDPSLGNNRTVMDEFIRKVREAKEQDNIDFITVSGFASPDGTSRANERLSLLRCQTIADYICKHTGVERNSIDIIPGGVAWDELRRMVEADPKVPSRDEVLDILNNTPLWIFNAEGKIVDGRKAQLMSLSRGIPYRWMLQNLFPELRNAVAVTMNLKSGHNNISNSTLKEDDKVDPNSEDYNSGNFEEIPGKTNETIDTNVITIINESNAITNTLDTCVNTPDSPELLDKTDISDPSKPAPVAPVQSEASLITYSVMSTHKPFYMNVKTNLLYDAALIPSLGAEVYVGKDISIYGEWSYAWWDRDDRHRYWRVYGGDIGARWWFGQKAHAKPLTGHHVGIYAGILTFDLEFGKTGYMGGKPGGTLWERWLFNTGVEYGYSLPVAKRLNIDFSIGLGYFGGNYITYFPFDNDYFREKEYKIRFFGPTKAEISFVWLLGPGNTNRKEGGGR